MPTEVMLKLTDIFSLPPPTKRFLFISAVEDVESDEWELSTTSTIYITSTNYFKQFKARVLKLIPMKWLFVYQSRYDAELLDRVWAARPYQYNVHKPGKSKML